MLSQAYGRARRVVAKVLLEPTDPLFIGNIVQDEESKGGTQRRIVFCLLSERPIDLSALLVTGQLPKLVAVARLEGPPPKL